MLSIIVRIPILNSQCIYFVHSKMIRNAHRLLNSMAVGAGGEGRADTVLFIDARHIYRQVDRAHREWTPAQIGFLANLVRLYRGEELDFTLGGNESKAKLFEVFGRDGSPSRPQSVVGRAGPPGQPESSKDAARPAVAPYLAYRDIPGLCKAAS